MIHTVTDDHLAWPFFEPRHRTWQARVCAFAAGEVPPLVDHADVDGSCRALVRAMGRAGLLKAAVAPGADDRLDVRTLCLAREALAYEDGLADFAFAMQGLGTGPISLFGDARAEGPMVAEGGERRGHRRLRAVGAGGRIGRRGAGADSHARWRGPRAPRRREDLDLQRRHRRPLRRLRPHGRGAGWRGG